jgi:hypothetical protein
MPTSPNQVILKTTITQQTEQIRELLQENEMLRKTVEKYKNLYYAQIKKE